MIETPYLLYLGHSSDPADIKTSRGLAVFRPDICIGEYRHDDCPLTLDLPRMDFAAAYAAGARTLVLGIANAGGRLGEDLIVDALAAMEAGLDIASGLHHRLNAEPRLIEAAARRCRQLHDVRDPRPDIPIGNGKPRAGKRLLTVGTDCSVGKMYTTLCLASALLAIADRNVGPRVAHVVELAAESRGGFGQPRVGVQPLVQPRRDVESRLHRGQRVED